MRTKIIIFCLLLLSLVGLFSLIKKDSKPSDPISPPPFTQTTTSEMLSLKPVTPVSFDDQYNIYNNSIHQFSFLYPKHFEINFDEKSINIWEKRSDGPWLMNIQITPATAKTVDEWVESENLKRDIRTKIQIVKTFKQQGFDVLYLQVPVAIDQAGEGPTIYAGQDQAILIKDSKLFTFLLREQQQDDTLKKEFYALVESLHFM